eukprot:gene10323-10480_t
MSAATDSAKAEASAPPQQVPAPTASTAGPDRCGSFSLGPVLPGLLAATSFEEGELRELSGAALVSLPRQVAQGAVRPPSSPAPATAAAAATVQEKAAARKLRVQVPQQEVKPGCQDDVAPSPFAHQFPFPPPGSNFSPVPSPSRSQPELTRSAAAALAGAGGAAGHAEAARRAMQPQLSAYESGEIPRGLSGLLQVPQPQMSALESGEVRGVLDTLPATAADVDANGAAATGQTPTANPDSNELIDKANTLLGTLVHKAKDGFVHDRLGNKWHPTSKVLLEAGPGQQLYASPGSAAATKAAAVALEALQHNLSTLDTTSFKSSATLELEASTLKSSAAKLASTHGWDVRSLLLHLSSGMKYLEWAHSFAGSGGVGVASISKQQAYKTNLSEAVSTVRSCAKLAKQQIVQRAQQRKAAGSGQPQPPTTAVDYAFAAVRLLADKLDAVAGTNLLFSGTQNSASSAIELVPVAAEGSSRATDRADLADGVQDYLTLTEAGGGSSGAPMSAAALAAAHRVGQLILAVGFEAGLWDLPSVLDIARQASDAIINLVEVYGGSQGAGAGAAAPGPSAQEMAQQLQACAPEVNSAGVMLSLEELQQENCLLRQQLDELRAQMAETQVRPDAVAVGNVSAAAAGGDETTSDCGLGCSDRRQMVHDHQDQMKQQQEADGNVPSQQGGSSSSSSYAFSALHGLTKGQVERYSRHLLLPSFGIAAQGKLCHCKVLIVGCGGLGSPAALYLAAAGVGSLGLVDHDVVELSNMHRQVIHTEERLGLHKAESAAAAVRAVNSQVSVQVHRLGLQPSNAVDVISQYDIVIDASDNPPTRYLISDTCVACGVPLVSAAAVGTDGQLTVYNYGKALEAVKVATGVGEVLAGKLLLFDALSGRFTSIKLRGKAAGCVACGGSAIISKATIASYDYAAFTGGQSAHDGPPPPLNIMPAGGRLSPLQLRQKLNQASAASAGQQRQLPATSGCSSACDALQADSVDAEAAAVHHVLAAGSAGTERLVKPLLLDVRPVEQFAIMSVPGAVNVPFLQLEQMLPEILEMCSWSGQQPSTKADSSDRGMSTAAGSGGGQGSDMSRGGHRAVYVMCRRGNHSQLAVQRLREAGVGQAVDVIGGYEAWAAQVDPGMPVL